MSRHWLIGPSFAALLALFAPIERAFALSTGRSQIEAVDLPPEIQRARETPLTSTVTLPDDGLDLEAFVAGIERDLIERSLERSGGNKGQAARLLNTTGRIMNYKVKQLGIDWRRFRK